MKITVLDAKTLGDDVKLDIFKQFGQLEIYDKTEPELVKERIKNSDVVIINKVRLNETNLGEKVKLICIAATGYDNVDVDYCSKNGIGVCNVKGYSSASVAQVTVGLVLSLVNKLDVYQQSVKDGSYTKSGIQNKISPAFHEIDGMTWGIIGYGNIGKKVGQVAQALGAKVVVYKRNADDSLCVPLKQLLKESDIITVHTPLTEETHHLINEDNIKLLKKNCIIVNTARGAVIDEKAISAAVKTGVIEGFGTDVYSTEPLQADSPIYEIKDLPNVVLTPHMAWAAYEARVRCINEMAENIKSFINGDIRNRLDLV